MIDWILATVLASAGVALAVYAPRFLASRRYSYEKIDGLADQFSGHVTGLEKSGAPDLVIDVVHWLGAKFGDKQLVRTLVIAAATGRLAAHANKEQNGRTTFSGVELTDLQANHLAGAISAALRASAARSIVWGLIFTRLMMPNPRAPRETATAYAEEIVPQNVRWLAAA